MPTLPPPSTLSHQPAALRTPTGKSDVDAASHTQRTSTDSKPADSLEASLPTALKPYANKLNPVMTKFQNDVKAALAEPNALELAKGAPLINRRELSPAQRQAIERAATELLSGIEGALSKAPEDIARA